MNGFTKNQDGTVTYRGVIVTKLANNDWTYPTTNKYQPRSDTRAGAFLWIDRAIERTERATAYLAENPEAPVMSDYLVEFEAVREEYRKATSALNTSYGNMSHNSSLVAREYRFSETAEAVQEALAAVEVHAATMAEHAQTVLALNAKMAEYIAAGAEDLWLEFKSAVSQWNSAKNDLDNQLIYAN